LALSYYAEKRLTTAIQAVSLTPVSLSTLKGIADKIDELKRGSEAFLYGRNYANALSGIVWAVAGLSLVRELSSTLGIPSPSYRDPFEYVPAAYDILVRKTKTPLTRAARMQTNRYIAHRDLADNGRAILLDVEALDNSNPFFAEPGNDLETWLAFAEDQFEGYRSAYLAVTEGRVDLGAKRAPMFEQAVVA
jgi:hypothetical protein